MKHIGLSFLLLLSAALPAGAQIQNGCITDYIIVGNGTAGATLAGMLSATNPVLVLEQGLNYATDPNILSTNPAIVFSLGDDPKYSEISVSLLGNLFTGILGFPYSEGRMWGGSSAHNFLLAVRGTPDIYDQWATISGDTSWTYNNLLPLMLFLENYTPNGTVANPAQRGSGGPLDISQAPVVTNDPFAIALATTVNVPQAADYNDPTLNGNLCVSAGQQYITPPYNPGTSTRSFSVTAFEPQTVVNYTTGQGIGRALNIVSEATVTRVLFDGTTAVGVEYILGNDRERVFRAYARKKVILCAGAIHDPAILQRSGIGDATLLNSLGIPVIVDNPLVGANLQTHYGPVMAFDNTEGGATTGLSIAAFHDTDNTPVQRVIQDLTVIAPFQFNIFPQPQVLIEQGVTANQNIIVMSPQLVRNDSTGTVAIVDSDPLNQPNINFDCYEGGQAGDDAQAAIAVLRLLNNAPLNVTFPIIFPTAADYADLTNTRLFQAAQNVYIAQFHGCGTCAMGSVVDGDLNVIGVNNLMVADLAAAPVVTTGNTAYPAYLIGLNAAQKLGVTIS